VAAGIAYAGHDRSQPWGGDTHISGY
jgi:hypothetical protein